MELLINYLNNMVRAKDKSMEQLNNDKKLDQVIQIGVLIILVISIWQFRNAVYNKGYENGRKDAITEVSRMIDWCGENPIYKVTGYGIGCEKKF